MFLFRYWLGPQAFQPVDIVSRLHGWNMFFLVIIVVAHHLGILDFQSGHTTASPRNCEDVANPNALLAQLAKVLYNWFCRSMSVFTVARVISNLLKFCQQP